MIRQTDLPTTIHLRRFPIEFGDSNFGRSRRVGDRNVKLEVEFVLEKVVDVPTFSPPSRSFFVGFQSEPVVILFLVIAHVLDQRLVLLFQPRWPVVAIAWT